MTLNMRKRVSELNNIKKETSHYEMFDEIEGILCDLDGVLYVDNELLPKAKEAVNYLLASEKKVIFCTNTTKNSIKGLENKLLNFGLNIPENLILSPPKIAIEWLKNNNYPSIYPLINQELFEDFAEFNFNFANPDYILIGDIGKTWTYDLMNEIFNKLMNGAEILALHKGKFWQAQKGLRIDIGAFINAFEYATNKKAHIFGKPNEEYFLTACKKMDLSPKNVLMLGDDIISDVDGAMKCGLKGGIIKTGKYREDYANKSGVEPNYELDSIYDIIKLI